MFVAWLADVEYHLEMMSIVEYRDSFVEKDRSLRQKRSSSGQKGLLMPMNLHESRGSIKGVRDIPVALAPLVVL